MIGENNIGWLEDIARVIVEQNSNELLELMLAVLNSKYSNGITREFAYDILKKSMEAESVDMVDILCKRIPYSYFSEFTWDITFSPLYAAIIVYENEEIYYKLLEWREKEFVTDRCWEGYINEGVCWDPTHGDWDEWIHLLECFERFDKEKYINYAKAYIESELKEFDFSLIYTGFNIWKEKGTCEYFEWLSYQTGIRWVSSDLR